MQPWLDDQVEGYVHRLESEVSFAKQSVGFTRYRGSGLSVNGTGLCFESKV